MTASQSRKTAYRARCLSTGHGRARPDIRQPPQIVRQSTPFNAAGPSFMSCSALGQLAEPAQFQSNTSSAARKSP